MKIEVVSVRLVDPKESGLRGFADIRLEDAILIRDFRIFQRTEGKPFIQEPHHTYKKDGQIRFNSIIEFPEELRVRIYTAIFTAYFREKEKENGKQEIPPIHSD